MSKQIVIVDIDGTIAKVGDRIKYLQQSPKDWDAFYADTFEDEPMLEMIRLVKILRKSGYWVAFCTGRRESCRTQTVKWLKKHYGPILSESRNPLLAGLPHYELFMRPDKDHRHDTILKPEILEKAGITVDDVAFILEDRNVMVQKWRELGFTCLQVADGDF